LSVLFSWFPLIIVTVVLLVAVSLLEQPIREAVRLRWPRLDYDAQSMLVWGVVALSILTTLAFLASVLFPP
jgi:uncharacterized protein (DUF2236 family)